MALHAPLPRLYAITDLVQARAASQADLVARLVTAGVRLVQTRGSAVPESAWCEDLIAATRAARLAGALLIVNDRPDLALLAGADGVHLGDSDLSVSAARRVLGPERIIGLSTHSVEEALEAASLAVDYIALGPIFDSPTKQTGRMPLGLEAIAAIRRRLTLPLVAIGGITLDRAAAVREAGADSVAVISDLYAGDLANRVGKFLTLLGQ